MDRRTVHLSVNFRPTLEEPSHFDRTWPRKFPCIEDPEYSEWWLSPEPETQHTVLIYEKKNETEVVIFEQHKKRGRRTSSESAWSRTYAS